MANVGFKLGLQSAVDTLISKNNTANAAAVPGAFYLTSDTHRLYIGDDDKNLNPVNEGIQFVTTLSQLPGNSGVGLTADQKLAMTGRFYYVEKDNNNNTLNVLCVYNGNHWVQINTYSDTVIKTDADNGHTYNISTTNNDATIQNIISTSDNVNHTATMHLIGANGVNVTSSGTNVTITGDTATLASAANATAGVDLNLTSAGSTSTVNIQGVVDASGVTNSNVVVSRDATTGALKISAKDTSIKTDANNGLVAGYGASNQGFKLTVNMTDNTQRNVTFTPTIGYGQDSNNQTTETANFVNGKAELSVYTKAQVDDKFKVLNAMTYRGVISSTSSVASGLSGTNGGVSAIVGPGGTGTVNVSIGDTFMLGQDMTYSGLNLTKGSLIIVRDLNGNGENSSGYLDAADVTFDVVESTNNTDTTYKFVASSGQTNGGGIILQGSNNAQTGGLVILGDDAGTAAGITVTAASSDVAGGGKSVTLTIAHDTVTTSSTAETTVVSTSGQQNIDVISGITTDATGHLTAYTTKRYTLNFAKVTNVTSSVGVSSNTATVTTSVTTSAGNATTTESGSYTVESSSLTLAQKTGGMTIDLVWGSF